MSNPGQELERWVSKVNIQYRLDEKAIIQKIEQPVRVTNQGIIPVQSTVDYIGSIGPEGEAVAFDAKETIVETRFDLKNIKQHQEEFLKYWEKTGGRAGFLVWFKQVDPEKAFWVPIHFVVEFRETETRQSIPYKKFRKEWKVPIDNYLQL